MNAGPSPLFEVEHNKNCNYQEKGGYREDTMRKDKHSRIILKLQETNLNVCKGNNKHSKTGNEAITGRKARTLEMCC